MMSQLNADRGKLFSYLFLEREHHLALQIVLYPARAAPLTLDLKALRGLRTDIAQRIALADVFAQAAP